MAPKDVSGVKLVKMPNTDYVWLKTNELSLQLIGDPIPKQNPKVLREWWWLLADGEPVGYGGLRHFPEFEAAYLCGAGIVSAWRGAKLQRRLLQARIRSASQRGYIAVITDTTSDNFASINNLISCGFKLYDPEYPWCEGTRAMYWIRELKK